MSSSVDGATGARTPSQANGYSLANSRRRAAGMTSRQTPWKPSQPATKSHCTSCSAPSWEKRMTGASVVTPPGRTSAASNQTVPSRRDQVLHDLLLAVDGDALPGELREVDAVALAVELQVDRVVHGAFGQHAPAHAAVAQQVGRPLLEHAGPHAGLDVGAGAAFDDDAPDPRQMQQVRQHQARRAGADDADLRA